MNFEYDRFYCLVIFKIDRFLFKMKTCNESALPVADPDPQIRRGGGHPDPEIRGGVLKIRGDLAPRAPPLDKRHWLLTV